MPDEESPFARPPVSHGYPLDPQEKAAVEHALRKLEQSRNKPQFPAHRIDRLRESESPDADPRSDDD